MVYLKTFIAASLAVSAVSAFPLQKRIAQIIAESTQDWVAACVNLVCHFK
jgi:hypothetical protein